MSNQFVLPQNLTRATLLLHSCCAPCSTACIQALKDYFDITVFYFNPNITDKSEYEKRKAEQIKYLKAIGGVAFIEGEYDNKEFFDACKGLEGEKEGGKRCEKCIALRLDQTARLAEREGFQYFCSTLSVSPHKNSKFINEYGKGLSGTSLYLENDFKKNNGYLQSIKLSKEYGLYRQNFCGCIFSKREGDK